MSQPQTMIEIPDALFEPVQLVNIWQQTAQQLIAQDQAAAAGAFIGCASMLSNWISHEGSHVMMCMPRSLLGLMFAAHAFDPRDKDTWKQLGQAAVDFRSAQ